jgi:quercetin dioxygenase-like cupin family protein
MTRRDLSLALLCSSAVLRGATLPDKTVAAKDARLTREPFGEVRIYFEGATEQVRSMIAGSLRLKPGAEPHPPHQHEEEEFLLVTEGTGEISLEGAVTRIGPGAMMYCAANRLHGIRNTGQTALEFYFFKWKV